MVHCFDLPVAANPNLRRNRGGVDILALAERTELRTDTANVLRFKVIDVYTKEAKSELKDLRFILSTTGGWRQRGVARPVGAGEYEVTLSAPIRGVYYLSFEIPSLGFRFNDRSPVILRATAP